jgi:Na+-driven multidrug efflux pump
MLKRYIGDRAFYKRALTLAVPILIQNGITNFVSLLDNIMVGQIGTVPMTGVSIANQLLLIFNLCILGATAGAGIFTAQFYGKGDIDNVRYSHRMKYLVCLLLAILAITLFATADDPLISLYLKG